jgi:hypothetical protein
MLTPVEVLFALERGRIEARLGHGAAAMSAYRAVVSAWSKADRQLQPMVRGFARPRRPAQRPSPPAVRIGRPAALLPTRQPPHCTRRAGGSPELSSASHQTNNPNVSACASPRPLCDAFPFGHCRPGLRSERGVRQAPVRRTDRALTCSQPERRTRRRRRSLVGIEGGRKHSPSCAEVGSLLG